MTIDVCHLEDTQAALEALLALVDLLREYSESAARHSHPTDKPNFDCLTLNLHNAYSLLYTLRSDITAAVNSAYRTPRASA